MKNPYKKTPRTFDDQINLLKERGLTIPNEEKAIKVLQTISYNRLSYYWYPMLEEPKYDEIFKPNSNFEIVFRLYKFDSELRHLFFSAIEQIEVALRTQLIYHLSLKFNSGFWYAEPNAFAEYANFLNNMYIVTKSVEETKEEFIKKYREKYNDYLVPAWKSFELLTFRPLINIFRALKDKADRNKISYFFGLNNEVFVSWLESLVYIRNICAHHARLWNIQLMIQPEKAKKTHGKWVSAWHNNTQANEKLPCYAISCILAFLLDRINPHHTFKKDLKQLFEKYAEVDQAHMGFPSNWQEELLWL